MVKRRVSFCFCRRCMCNLCHMLFVLCWNAAWYWPKWYHIFSVHWALLNYQVASLNQTSQAFWFLTSKRLRTVKVILTSVFCCFCFPGILTMSMPWMTGARPSVGCKCRSYNSWSCRYCLSVCFRPKYLCVVFSWHFLSVCRTPPCLSDISHGVTRVGEGGGRGAEWNNFVHLRVTSH